MVRKGSRQYEGEWITAEQQREMFGYIPTDADWAADASGMFGEGAEGLYREFYCARGDMESERSGDDAPEACPGGVSEANQNRIKEQQMDLFASRTSTGKMASNQLRLHPATFAYMLMCDLRGASPGTLRLRLLKIAAQVTVSVRRIHVRRIHVRLCSACPEADLFALVHRRLQTFELPA